MPHDLMNLNTSVGSPAQDLTCISLSQSQDPERDEGLRRLGLLDEVGILDEVLAAFEYDSLPESDYELVADHLRECPSCRSRLTNLAGGW